MHLVPYCCKLGHHELWEHAYKWNCENIQVGWDEEQKKKKHQKKPNHSTVIFLAILKQKICLWCILYQRDLKKVPPDSPWRRTAQVREDSFLKFFLTHVVLLGWSVCWSDGRHTFLSVHSQNDVWIGSMKFVALHQSELFVQQTSKQTKTKAERKSELLHQWWDW